MNKNLFYLLVSTLLISCSSNKSIENLKRELNNGEGQFVYADKNGQFVVKQSSGLNKKDKTYFLKKSLETGSGEERKILEQSIVFSQLGTLKKHTTILRPKNSQYSVWFDGKKYTSELKLNLKKRTLDLKMTSPESQWNGEKQVKLPSAKSIYCFFSQTLDCVKATGFLKQAIKKETGRFSLYIIWEGYPYLNETFSDFPSELISKAEFEFDGNINENSSRFNLKVAGQSIFYIVDKDQKLKKMLWVSQGISMISKMAQREDKKKNKFPDENGDMNE